MGQREYTYLMIHVVLIVMVIASLPFLIWLVATLMHNKHLPWEARILDDPLYCRPPIHSITQLRLNNRKDPDERE